MEAYLWGRRSLFRSILAHRSHFNKLPVYLSIRWEARPAALTQIEASRSGLEGSYRTEFPRWYRDASRSLQQLLRRDGQVADALSGRVVNGVGDRRGDAHDRELADPLDAERVGVRVGLTDKEGVDRRGVCVGGDEVARKVGGDELAQHGVHRALFQERHPEPPGDPAYGLIPGRLRIEYRAYVEDPEGAGEPHDPEVRIYPYFDVLGAEVVRRMLTGEARGSRRRYRVWMGRPSRTARLPQPRPLPAWRRTAATSCRAPPA